jgi:hypothetical protein
MTQPEIDALERLQKMEAIAHRVESVLPRLEAALAATPAESNAALEKKVDEVDNNCAVALRELSESLEAYKGIVEKYLVNIDVRLNNLEVVGNKKVQEESLTPNQEA